MLKSRLKAFFTDQRSAMVIRWWVAGAVYFFIGWGTAIGQQSMVGLAFSLGLVMGLLNILIVNPSLRLLFNIGTNKRPQHENTFIQRVSDNLVELLKALFIIFTIALIYHIINSTLAVVLGLPPDVVLLPGEPIMFGIFYVFVFWCLELLVNKIKKIIVNRAVKSDK